MPLGVEGFTYADLYSPARLQDLYERFCREVAAADPAFWAEWDAYRREPDAPRSPVARPLSRRNRSSPPASSWA